MAESPITGYTVVLSYHDNSAIIAAFGPYPSEKAAFDAIEVLKQMPLTEGTFEAVPLFGAPGQVVA